MTQEGVVEAHEAAMKMGRELMRFIAGESGYGMMKTWLEENDREKR